MTLICKGSRSDHPAVPSAVNPGIAPLRLLLYRFLYICCRIEEEIAMVTAVAYTNFRRDLKSYLRRVNDDADMLLVTNKDPHDNVVVMSADDYESLMETLRVYQNPGLFDKVRRGMAQVRSGAAATHDLVGE